jgi:hypothetical protein
MYKLTIDERFNSFIDASASVEKYSENLDELKKEFDNYVMLESLLATMIGWETDEWETKRGWYFEAYEVGDFENKQTRASLEICV